MQRWFTSANWGKQWRRLQRNVRLYATANTWPPKQVLVVEKTSRLDFELKKHPNLSPEALKEKLIRQGSKYETLESRRQVHRESLKQLAAHMKSWDVEVRVRHKETLAQEDVGWADLVIAAGGDGNYLRTASMVRTNSKPLIGINTDPHSSQGFLCLRPGKACSIGDLLGTVLTGNVRLFHRHRVRAVWDGGRKSTLALNEVLVGEKDPVQSSYYDLVVDSIGPERQKSSGVLVYTGTGSTSWAYNMNMISLGRVRAILAIAKEKGVRIPGDVDEDSLLKEVTQTYNSGNVFSGACPQMAFTVREPVTTGIFAAHTTHGFAKKLLIHTFSWQSGLMVDGQFHFRLHNGSVVEFSVHSEDALLSAELLET